MLAIHNPHGYVDLDSKFTKYCYSRNVANEFYGPNDSLTAWGWIFSVAFTWIGFILLFVGIFWAVDLPTKLIAQWRQIRANARGGATVLAREPLAVADNGSREPLHVN